MLKTTFVCVAASLLVGACDGEEALEIESRELPVDADADAGADAGDEPVGTCVDACGGAAADGSCWCDDLCEQYGDCCDDIADVCEAPAGPSCEEHCGGPVAGGVCWCDALCEQYGDCCEDYGPACEPEPGAQAWVFDYVPPPDAPPADYRPAAIVETSSGALAIGGQRVHRDDPTAPVDYQGHMLWIDGAGNGAQSEAVFGSAASPSGFTLVTADEQGEVYGAFVGQSTLPVPTGVSLVAFDSGGNVDWSRSADTNTIAALEFGAGDLFVATTQQQFVPPMPFTPGYLEFNALVQRYTVAGDAVGAPGLIPFERPSVGAPAPGGVTLVTFDDGTGLGSRGFATWHADVEVGGTGIAFDTRPAVSPLAGTTEFTQYATITPSGDLVVAGRRAPLNLTTPAPHAVLERYAEGGTLLWSLDALTPDARTVVGMAVDGDGATFVVTDVSPNDGADQHLHRVEADGTVTWSVLLLDEYDGETLRDLIVTATGAPTLLYWTRGIQADDDRVRVRQFNP